MLARVEEHHASSINTELRLRAHRSELRLARGYAREAALEAGLTEVRSYEFVYAVNEAVTNAIRHGAPDEWGEICLSIFLEGNRLTCVVRDYGTFVAPTREAAALTEGGRGFPLMAGLVDDFQLGIEPGCTTVRLSIGLPPSSGNDPTNELSGDD